MLIEFKFSNYRSFRDAAILSMEATGLGMRKSILIPYGSRHLLPAVAIYGKNGGGKSNVIRAFWLAVQFIRNAQRTQHESASVPVHPFLLDDSASRKATSFEFVYLLDGVKYVYGFSATKSEIIEEHLSHAPKGQLALVFSRDHQKFTFRDNPEKKRRQLISEAVRKNQLYISVACTMNERACEKAMQWFREYICFSQDYPDIPQQLLECEENPHALQAIKEYAKAADLGIQDMTFEFQHEIIQNTDRIEAFTMNMPEDLRSPLAAFLKNLPQMSNLVQAELQADGVKAASFHTGIDNEGKSKAYRLSLGDESDGTLKLMSLAPAIEKVLNCGGVLLVDELEREMHPLMVMWIVSKFQSPESNPRHAQIIFTTHDTNLLTMDLLRKDQLYFADKSAQDGSSSLYSISEFSTPTSENIRKGYLMGKYGGIPDLPIEEVE